MMYVSSLCSELWTEGLAAKFVIYAIIVNMLWTEIDCVVRRLVLFKSIPVNEILADRNHIKRKFPVIM